MRLNRKRLVLVTLAVIFSIIWALKKRGVSRMAKLLQELEDDHVEIIRRYSDKSRKYLVLSTVFKGENLTKHDDVTLITHCDVSGIHDVISLQYYWGGPMHISIYINTENLLDPTVMLIEEIRDCYELINAYTTWHIIYPSKYLVSELENWTVDYYERPNHLDSDANFKKSCTGNIQGQLMQLEEEYRKVKYENNNESYPAALCINTAKKHLETEFLFVVHHELIPSSGLRQLFLEYANSKNWFGKSKNGNGNKTNLGSVLSLNSIDAITASEDALKHMHRQFIVCAAHIDGKSYPSDIYIVPTFETNPVNEIVRDVQALKELGYKARQYYKMNAAFYTATCHRFWLSYTQDKLNCGYSVDYARHYQPFYIGRNSEPLYDENFYGQFFTQQTQIATLAALGYKFNVLTGAFLLHHGWKSWDSEVEEKYQKSMKKNEIAWQQLLERLERKVYK